MKHFSITIPLSLYIHIPWCVKKCPYCDFNSHEAKQTMPEEAYVERLIEDLKNFLPLVSGRKLISIFFGGGTPSLFAPHSIEKILNDVNKLVSFSSNIEISLEANPGTVDEQRFADFRKAGVNRLSLGVQSLQPDKLKTLGRIHNREQALSAIHSIRKAGFDNFNVDLMHGLPGQTIEEALSDLQDVLQFEPPHLSWYQLTIEPNTFFYRFPPILPQDETLWKIQEAGQAFIRSKGLQQYEVSAYSLDKNQCVHNKNYWEFGDYIGIGAGAHSKITDLAEQSIKRLVRFKHPKDYLAKSFENNFTVIAERDLIFEFMLNALRLNQGVPVSLFEERTGLPLETIKPMLQQALNKKLLLPNEDILRATALGKNFLNDLIEIFLKNNS